jgi:hypothetical protein
VRGISKLLTKSPRELWLLAEAAWFLCMFSLSLRLIPFRYVLRFRFGSKRVRGDRANAVSVADGVNWAINATSSRIPGTERCLIRALAAREMLLRRSIDAKLRIGVPKSSCGDFEAHAWVESEGGKIIGESKSDRFVALPLLEM